MPGAPRLLNSAVVHTVLLGFGLYGKALGVSFSKLYNSIYILFMSLCWRGVASGNLCAYIYRLPLRLDTTVWLPRAFLPLRVSGAAFGSPSCSKLVLYQVTALAALQARYSCGLLITTRLL